MNFTRAACSEIICSRLVNRASSSARLILPRVCSSASRQVGDSGRPLKMLLPAASRVNSSRGRGRITVAAVEVRFGWEAVVSAFYGVGAQHSGMPSASHDIRRRHHSRHPANTGMPVPRTVASCTAMRMLGGWRKGSDRRFEDGVHGLRDVARRAGWHRPSCRSVARLPTQGRARSQALLRMSTVRHTDALPPSRPRARHWLVGHIERRAPARTATGRMPSTGGWGAFLVRHSMPQDVGSVKTTWSSSQSFARRPSALSIKTDKHL